MTAAMGRSASLMRPDRRVGLEGCGSLGAVGLRPAGIALPGTQADLFAVTTPVAAADVLPGDLVFLGTRESGPGHVGIALDPKTMLAADARAVRWWSAPSG